jgi:hypothetical protein
MDEDFRAVRVAAGDSIAAAIGTGGDLRAWTTFRARITSVDCIRGRVTEQCARRWKAFLAFQIARSTSTFRLQLSSSNLEKEI